MYLEILMIAYIIFLIQALRSESVIGFLMSFIGAFLQLWQMYVYLGADFVGISFLILYAGAISILFVFVFMAIGLKEITSSSKFNAFIAFIAASIFLVGLVVYVVFCTKLLDSYLSLYLLPDPWVPGDSYGDAIITYYNDITIFCIALYCKYKLLFICAGFILLASVFGILVLALPGSKFFSKRK